MRQVMISGLLTLGLFVVALALQEPARPWQQCDRIVASWTATPDNWKEVTLTPHGDLCVKLRK